jgi:hypothetical protein
MGSRRVGLDHRRTRASSIHAQRTRDVASGCQCVLDAVCAQRQGSTQLSSLSLINMVGDTEVETLGAALKVRNAGARAGFAPVRTQTNKSVTSLVIRATSTALTDAAARSLADAMAVGGADPERVARAQSAARGHARQTRRTGRHCKRWRSAKAASRSRAR